MYGPTYYGHAHHGSTDLLTLAIHAPVCKVRVLQCVGHFLHDLAEGRSSDLHDLAEGRSSDLHDLAEGRSSDALLRSDYPLLLLHAQVRSKMDECADR